MSLRHPIPDSHHEGSLSAVLHQSSPSLKSTHTYIHIYIIQGGEDASDALSCRYISAKEPLVIGLFRGK